MLVLVDGSPGLPEYVRSLNCLSEQTDYYNQNCHSDFHWDTETRSEVDVQGRVSTNVFLGFPLSCIDRRVLISGGDTRTVGGQCRLGLPRVAVDVGENDINSLLGQTRPRRSLCSRGELGCSRSRDRRSGVV